MSYSIRPPTLSAQLGAGIGKGFGEQLPKEIERVRFQKGLEGLDLSKATDPLKLISSVYSIPGMTPEKFNAIAPYLQSQMARNQATQRAGLNGQNQPTNIESIAGVKDINQPSPSGVNPQQTGIQPAAPTQHQQPNKRFSVEEITSMKPTEVSRTYGNLTPEQRQLQSSYFQEPKPEEINKLAAEAYNQNPQLFSSESDARDRIIREIGEKKSAFESSKQPLNIAENLIKEADTQFSEALKRQGINEEASGLGAEMLQGYRDKVRALTEAGEDPKKAARDQADIVKKLHKEVTNINELGPKWNFRKGYENQRNDYIKNTEKMIDQGFLNQAADLVGSAEGLTPITAHGYINPISKDKPVYNVLKELPKPDAQNLSRTINKEIPIDVMKNITNSINENTDLLSIASYLDSIEYDSQSFLQMMKDLQGKIKLNKQQEEQIEKPYSVPGLGEILLRNMLNSKGGVL